ncbi:MAG: hypothetical protein KME35_13940 [Aphanocapsa sp. GSE-SYN-MK-11-07L]|jgi:hypothetical protein|nr:hypothetical protein [Aphanocapsa sp. GSE-SYN-MK-11-07L]
MYSEEEIKRCFDETTHTYLQHKNRGGSNGQKGTRYEDYFITYQLALLASSVIENDINIDLLSQVCAFVDDLIIDCPNSPLKHYQLKNSLAVSWTSGQRSISQDFE